MPFIWHDEFKLRKFKHLASRFLFWKGGRPILSIILWLIDCHRWEHYRLPRELGVDPPFQTKITSSKFLGASFRPFLALNAL